MACQDYGAALSVKLIQISKHRGGIVRVQIAGRLVGKDDLRAVQYAPGYGGTLLFAGAKLRGLVINSVCQAEFFYQLISMVSRPLF